MKRAFALVLSLILMLGCCVSVSAASRTDEDLKFQFNGEMIELQTALQFESEDDQTGDLYLPIREMMGLMDGKVTWNGENRTVVVEFTDKFGYEKIVFTVGSERYYMYAESQEEVYLDEEFDMDKPVYVDAATGRAYMHHSVLEHSYYELGYDSDCNTVILASPTAMMVEKMDTMSFDIYRELVDYRERFQHDTWKMTMEVEGEEYGVERQGTFTGLFDVNDNSEYEYDFVVNGKNAKGAILTNMTDNRMYLSSLYDTDGNARDAEKWYMVELSNPDPNFVTRMMTLQVDEMDLQWETKMFTAILERELNSVDDFAQMNADMDRLLCLFGDEYYQPTESGSMKLEFEGQAGDQLLPEYYSVEIFKNGDKIEQVIIEKTVNLLDVDGSVLTRTMTNVETDGGRTQDIVALRNGEAYHSFRKVMTYELSDVEPNVVAPDGVQWHEVDMDKFDL